MYKVILLLSILVLPIVGFSADLFQTEIHHHILVHNRVLAKVNGKSISAVDVMKKMDILFYRQYPQYTSIVEARFQFYKQNWKHVLNDLIDKELIIADAEESKVPATSGDVRQEMEELFGPQIILNLDSIGMTFDEAYKIVLGDILLRRMMYLRANIKALQAVTPQSIRDTYEKLSKEQIKPEAYRYQVVSIRDQNPIFAEKTAQAAYRLLKEEQVSLSELAVQLKQLPESVLSSVTVSEEYLHNENELAQANKAVLTGLQSHEVSTPFNQKSRSDQSSVWRILCLNEKLAGGVLPFNELETDIREQLLGDAVAKETDTYLKRLRTHFDIQMMVLDDNYDPFSLETY